MKALTIRQPYASLLVHGFKLFETRSWSTDYRGLVAIHSGKTFENAFSPALIENLERVNGGPLLRGKVIAVAQLVEIVPALTAIQRLPTRLDRKRPSHKRLASVRIPEPPRVQESMFGDFANGMYAWVFAGIVPLAQPSEARGAQGLWDWPGHVRAFPR